MSASFDFVTARGEFEAAHAGSGRACVARPFFHKVLIDQPYGHKRPAYAARLGPIAQFVNNNNLINRYNQYCRYVLGL